MSDIENQHDREPTDDERMGMAWWKDRDASDPANTFPVFTEPFSP